MGNMTRDSLGRAALEILEGLGTAALEAFFPPTYSYTRIWRPFLGLDRVKKLKKATVSTVLWRLKREGLVAYAGAKKTAQWRLTEKGKVALADMRDEAQRQPLIPKSDGVARLVIFDVPERERDKRDMIRAELIGSGFSQLQKSVWIGHHPLPQDFIRMVEDIEASDHVHIFSVRGHGTLRGIK